MKFNFRTKRNHQVNNFEGAKAIQMTPEYELYTAVVTTGLNTSFYEAGNDRLKRIINLIQKCDPEFVARLAIYTRNNMYLRSIPLVLVVELAKIVKGSSLVSETVSRVVKRADEITELLAYYQIANQREGVKKLNRLSKQIQKGLGSAFNHFDEYQFAKYNRNTDVKLKDALFLVHPKAKDEYQQMIFNKIARDELSTPYTWETELSNLGQFKFHNVYEKKRALTQKWEALIESKKLGYMALMRNLRNILEANVSGKHIAMVCEYLSNENAVKHAKQLPFRFLAAYREVSRIQSSFSGEIMTALEIAAMHSAQNIKGFGYQTSVLIACDVSGSMQQPISKQSKILMYDIGLILGMLMHTQCKNVITGLFGDNWKTFALPKNSVLANVKALYKREGEVGYSTNGYKVIDHLIKTNTRIDKVMIFTDTQMWDNTYMNKTFAKSWAKYKLIAPQSKLYLFDLAGYGKQPIDIRQQDVHLIAGWSDKIFDLLAAMEQSEDAISTIKQIKL